MKCFVRPQAMYDFRDRNALIGPYWWYELTIDDSADGTWVLTRKKLNLDPFPLSRLESGSAVTAILSSVTVWVTSGVAPLWLVSQCPTARLRSLNLRVGFYWLSGPSSKVVSWSQTHAVVLPSRAWKLVSCYYYTDRPSSVVQTLQTAVWYIWLTESNLENYFNHCNLLFIIMWQSPGEEEEDEEEKSLLWHLSHRIEIDPPNLNLPMTSDPVFAFSWPYVQHWIFTTLIRSALLRFRRQTNGKSNTCKSRELSEYDNSDVFWERAWT